MKVFISSTIVDLRQYRMAARDAILAAGHEPVLTELIPRSRDVSEDVAGPALEQSDVYVLLLGSRYGARRPGGLSWIEHEALTAQALGKPTLVYVLTGLGPRTGGPEAAAFRARVADAAFVKLVTTPLAFALALTADLAALTSGKPPDTATASIVLAPISRDQITTLLAHPDDLQRCSSRFFEELVAELLRADGWDVELIARHNAPGPDIIAISSRLIQGVPLKMIVECKRYAVDAPVDVDVVRKVMYWVNEEHRATMGMIATTSRFTAPALAQAHHHEWRLALRDEEAILAWMGRNQAGG